MRWMALALLTSGCAARVHVGAVAPTPPHPAPTTPVVAAHVDAIAGARFRFRDGVTFPDGPTVGLGVGARSRPSLAGGQLAAGPEVLFGVAPDDGLGFAVRAGVLPMLGTAPDGYADLAMCIPVDASVTFGMVSLGATIEWNTWSTPWLQSTRWVGGTVGIGW